MIKTIWTLIEVRELIYKITDQQSDPYPHPEEHGKYRIDYWDKWFEDYCSDNVDNYITLSSAFNSLKNSI